MQGEEETDQRRSRKVSPLVIVLSIVFVVCIVGGIAGGMYLINTFTQIRDVENTKTIEPTLPENNSTPQDNPIDFASLEKANSDIYAWIYLPGTSINYPVCQNAEDASYYLTHNASKEESQLGAIFSEAQFNAKDFQSPVTILYGHNGYGDTMFAALHKFESSDFFNANDKFYIYAPGHIYTYEIVSAFMTDGSHLMGTYDFQSKTGMDQFVRTIKNPNSMGAMTRDVKAGVNDKYVVLSTCNSGALESVGRYVVCGVMTGDQPTK